MNIWTNLIVTYLNLSNSGSDLNMNRPDSNWPKLVLNWEWIGMNLTWSQQWNNLISNRCDNYPTKTWPEPNNNMTWSWFESIVILPHLNKTKLTRQKIHASYAQTDTTLTLKLISVPKLNKLNPTKPRRINNSSLT